MEGGATKANESEGYAWSLVFAANLVAPLGLAVLMTTGFAWIGVAAGVVLLWLLGRRLSATSDDVGRVLVIGGCLVAATQICPVAQFVAGSVGVAFGETVGREAPEWTLRGPIGGFVATIVTGGILMVMADFCGTIASLLFPRRPSGRPVIGSPLFDRQLDG